MAHGHPHPFEIIKSVVPEENWLSFLKEARSCGQKFYDDSVAYMWAKQVFIEFHEGRKKDCDAEWRQINEVERRKGSSVESWRLAVP